MDPGLRATANVGSGTEHDLQQWMGDPKATAQGFEFLFGSPATETILVQDIEMVCICLLMFFLNNSHVHCLSHASVSCCRFVVLIQNEEWDIRGPQPAEDRASTALRKNIGNGYSVVASKIAVAHDPDNSGKYFVVDGAQRLAASKVRTHHPLFSAFGVVFFYVFSVLTNALFVLDK